ncbi:hypothetical protein PNH38_08975 [Anoxybacillus rupiensis]|uniref:Uncharacterized protein n=1 Tax=Anoxybacteroides rupiense TaxID=311460 RepID=A0ABT5W3X9_9BACL|nr:MULTISPECIES: hypothetical protein [Anoxybacillus]MDE8564019.1 hypothetical protein [Anoxybacillus rupiensis]
MRTVKKASIDVPYRERMMIHMQPFINQGTEKLVVCLKTGG